MKLKHPPKRRRSLFVWWVLFPLMVLCVTLGSFARLHHGRAPDGGTQWSGGAADTLESCTYQQLLAAFGTPKQHQQLDSFPVEQDLDEQCWSLTDRILRIPKSAILNFDSLIPLGAGNKGGVFIVFINLRNNKNQVPCKAAYKTDLRNTNLCAKVWTHPFAFGWSRTKSCLSAHLNPFRSSMPGELTGGIMFQAFRQYAVDHPDAVLEGAEGIMPTWGMVQLHQDYNSDNHETTNHHFSFRGRQNHYHKQGDYPSVLGMIMPYEDLVPLKPLVAQGRTASEMAGLMHSAAQGLALVHELGLTHQDLIASNYKNVGFVKSADGSGKLLHSIIFDWGYTALDDNEPAFEGQDECTLGRACNFCVESYFPSPRVGGDHGAAHSRRRTLDCENLRTMMDKLFDFVQDAEKQGQYWKAQMRNQVDCSRSTHELVDFLALAAKGKTP